MERISKLHVDLDELDRLDHDWLFVVLAGQTGVVYHVQCGGLSCRQGAIEGILVPVEAPDSYVALQQLFVRDLKSFPASVDQLAESGLERLRAAVEAIRIPVDSRWPEIRGSVRGASDIDWAQTHPTHLDESRLDEGYEAFIPVATPFGQGTLVWSNSD